MRTWSIAVGDRARAPRRRRVAKAPRATQSKPPAIAAYLSDAMYGIWREPRIH